MSCSAACNLTVMSRVIRSCPAAIWSAVWRKAARLDDIALSSCGSGEVMGGTIVAGAVCATAASGANQPNCGYEFAILSLAASPYDCQASVAKTPTQNVIRNLIIGTSLLWLDWRKHAIGV